MAGLIAGVISSLRNNLRQGSLFVDPYWVGFYVTNFQDGFRRRAIIGTLCRLLFPRGVSVITINIFSFLVAFALIALLMRAFVRLSTPTSFRLSLFTFAFFSSTLAVSFIETAGDTLQIAFVVFLGTFWVLSRFIEGYLPRLIFGFLLIAVGFMIHEASMFFLVPALPFFLRGCPRLSNFIAPTLLLVALFGLSVHWSHLEPSLTYQAIPFPHTHVLTEPVATPSFKELLRTEESFDFGSIRNIIRFGSKCLRLLVLLFSGSVGVCFCFPRHVFRRFLLALFAILLYNAPLWFIAHDWGRFLAYSFFFAIMTTAASPATSRHPTASQDRLLIKVSEWFRAVSSVHVISFAALFVLISSHTLFSRITGVDVQTFVIFIAIMVFAAFVSVTRPEWLAAMPLD